MGAEIKDAKKLPSVPHPPQGHQTSLAGGIHKAVPGFITIIKQSLGAGWAFQRPPSAPLHALPFLEMYYFEGPDEEVVRS